MHSSLHSFRVIRGTASTWRKIVVGTGRWWGAGPAAAGGTWTGLVRTGWADSILPEKKRDLWRRKSRHAEGLPCGPVVVRVADSEAWLGMAILREQCWMALSRELRTQDGWHQRLLRAGTLMPSGDFFKSAPGSCKPFAAYTAPPVRLLLSSRASFHCWCFFVFCSRYRRSRGQVHLFYWPSRIRLFVTPWTVARQAPLSMGFCRQAY